MNSCQWLPGWPTVTPIFVFPRDPITFWEWWFSPKYLSFWRWLYCTPLAHLLTFGEPGSLGFLYWWTSSRFMRPVARPAPPLRPRLEVLYTVGTVVTLVKVTTVERRWDKNTHVVDLQKTSLVVGLLDIFTPNFGGRWIHFDSYFLESKKKSYDGSMGLVIFTYTNLQYKSTIHVGKYTIHGSYGLLRGPWKDSNFLVRKLVYEPI